MAFERFAGDARGIVASARRREAETAGRGVIEAEHLLLALASDAALRHLELDHDDLAAALVREEEQSLAAVGVTATDFERAPARVPPRGTKLGTSAKLAIERAAKVTARRSERRMTAAHMLLGVLEAEHGRVPRALALAEVDVDQLRARL
jgi:hypothetical protein